MFQEQSSCHHHLPSSGLADLHEAAPILVGHRHHRAGAAEHVEPEEEAAVAVRTRVVVVLPHRFQLFVVDECGGDRPLQVLLLRLPEPQQRQFAQRFRSGGLRAEQKPGF